MKRSRFILSLASASLLFGCAAAPAIGALFPTAMKAIGIAGALIAQLRHWLDRFRSFSSLGPDLIKSADDLLDKAQATLDKTKELVAQGDDMSNDARQAYADFKAVLAQLLVVLESLGLYLSGSRALVAPAGTRTIRADGSAEEAETFKVELPPETL